MPFIITLIWLTALLWSSFLMISSSGITKTSNVQLKIGTDDSWSLVYDSMRRPEQLVRIEIECPVETILSSPNLKKSGYLINWFKNDKKLSIFNRRVHVDDAFLTIKHANRFDSGIYYCELITGAGSSLKSPKLSLELDHSDSSQEVDVDQEEVIEKDRVNFKPEGYEPVFINQPNNDSYFSVEASQIEFDCSANSYPNPQILWYKDDSIISEEDLGIVRNSLRLSLKNLYTTDSGIYKCTVSNHFGQINRTFNLQVIERETINQTIVADNMVILECPLHKDLIQGQSVKWFKRDDHHIFSGSSRIDIGDESYVRLNLFALNYPPHNIFQPVNYPSNVALVQLVAYTNPKVQYMQINDGSIVFRRVDMKDQGSYICSRSARSWSRRIQLIVTASISNSSSVSSQFTQFFRPLVLLFFSVCVSFVLVGLFIKYVCRQPCSQASKPKKATQQPQKSNTLRRLTSSPKNYEFYSNRWYSDNRNGIATSTDNYGYQSSNNYALVAPHHNEIMSANYLTIEDRRMHLNPMNLHQQNRAFMSIRSNVWNSQNPSLTGSKSCSRVSNR